MIEPGREMQVGDVAGARPDRPVILSAGFLGSIFRYSRLMIENLLLPELAVKEKLHRLAVYLGDEAINDPTAEDPSVARHEPPG
jgi:hypothetical protein